MGYICFEKKKTGESCSACIQIVLHLQTIADTDRCYSVCIKFDDGCWVHTASHHKTDGVFYSETPFLYTVTNSTEQDILPTKLQL